MKLLDSNILIYATSPSMPESSRALAATLGANYISVITQIEVLGWHQITPMAAQQLKTLLATFTIIPLEAAIVQTTITLRQSRKIALPDAVIAATALTHNLVLITRNVSDFGHIPGLKLENPLEA